MWDMRSPTDITRRQILIGHRAAINAIDFDEEFIVSASGDRTIKVWSSVTAEFVRTLRGHRRGIACLQYRDRLVVSGSSDNTIRWVFGIWHQPCVRTDTFRSGSPELTRWPTNRRSNTFSIWEVETGTCLRVLEGHVQLVRCLRFDKRYIVSGAYDGRIKIWDLQAALDPNSAESTLCLKTLRVSRGSCITNAGIINHELMKHNRRDNKSCAFLRSAQHFHPKIHFVFRQEHTDRVFRLQFDAFEMVSSSHDDTIVIWDFHSYIPPALSSP